MEAQKKAKAYNDLKSLFERRQKALETVNAQLEGSLRDATDECEPLQAQLTQAKLLLKKAYAQQKRDGKKEEEMQSLHVALKNAKANAVVLSEDNSKLASTVDRLEKDELDLRLMLKAAEERAKIAEI